jgi:hypothetical protein
MADSEFRQMIADFVATSCPKRLLHRRGKIPWAEGKEWHVILWKAGMIAPAWPVEHGGMGLKPAKHLIYLEETDRGGAPNINEQGTMNCGPALIMFGNDAQRQKFLPRILDGEHVWCQGFSEPNAGSDLASLRTEGIVDGDRIVINGQKIWTSGAEECNMMFALVRTDKTVRKQAGISFVLMDKLQSGITTRQIRTIDGEAHFSETFFDDAIAKLEDVVGGLNNGWKVANGLLGSERLWAGSPRHSRRQLALLERVARAMGRFDDPVFIDRFAQLVLDTEDLASTYRRTVSSLGSKGFGFEASFLKIWQTELSQRITELAIEVAGDAGSLLGDATVGDDEIDIMFPFMEQRAPTIYGGSVQIHRNILAKNVLQLPS